MAGGAARLALLLCVGALLGGAVAASVAEQIKELLKLKESGELSDDEFAEAKKLVLDGIGQKPAAGEFVGHYEALATAPPGAPAKQSCPAGFDITGVDEWIQGETTPDAGALTAFFFFSQSCHICHDVAPTLSKMHKKFRHRGFQVVGIHASPKGFKQSDKKIAELKEFIDKKKLAFSIVDTHSKEGPEIFLPGGEPDYQTMGAAPTIPGSLWEKVSADEPEPYGVPILIVMQNCKRVAVVGGYQIADIEKALEPHWPKLLWPDDGSNPSGGSKKKRKKKAKKEL